MNSGKRLPKTRREPDAFVHRRLTDRSLKIIEIVARYCFIATSAILRLSGGNEDVTHRHLQMLYHRNLIGRVKRPGNSRNTEFAYFLEDSPQVRTLIRNSSRHEFDGIDIGRQRKGSGYDMGESRPGRLLFVEHELMIADFHSAIEMAARESGGRVEFEEWKQGTSTWDRVAIMDGNGSGRMLPHRPDAYFVLRFPSSPPGQQRSRFFYEADRGTTNTTRFKLKLQAYLSFLLSGQYGEKYQAQKVRAVLVETPDDSRLLQLKAVAAELAETEALAGLLFWFTTSKDMRKNGGFAAVWSAASDVRLWSVVD